MRVANKYALVEGKLIDLKNIHFNAAFSDVNKDGVIVPTV